VPVILGASSGMHVADVMDATHEPETDGQRSDAPVLCVSHGGSARWILVLRDPDRVPRPVRGQATVAAAREARLSFQRRLPRAYSRSAPRHPGRHRIGSGGWAGAGLSLKRQVPLELQRRR
jgi:hypothetical protein